MINKLEDFFVTNVILIFAKVVLKRSNDIININKLII